MQDFQPCVYLLSDRYRGAVYTGVTSNLLGRIHQHREEILKGFTSRYGVKRLVWFEVGDDIEGAIRREKTIKRWRRQWKFDLIEGANPDWRDLARISGFHRWGKGEEAGPRIKSGVTKEEGDDRTAP